MWDDQFKAFAERYKVIRYDVRGFGKSEIPKRRFSHVEDLYGLLKFLNVDKAYLVGLSLGGYIAIDFAFEHPEMVDALVPAAPGLSGYEEISEEVQKRYWARYEAAKKEGVSRAVEMWLEDPMMVPAMENPIVGRKIRQIVTENPHSFLMDPNLIQEPDPPAIKRLPEIRVPTLIIVGERDMADIYAIVNTLEKGIAGAKKMVISGAGHTINMEKPEEFNRTVLDFLSKL